MESENRITLASTPFSIFNWIQPRSSNRDEQFRERSIRIAILLVMSLGLLSFFFTVAVFQNEWRLVSFPTVHVVVLGGFFLSAIAVTQEKLLIAAWLILIPIFIAVLSIAYLAGLEQHTSGVYIAIPELLLTLIIAALVLPRQYLLPLSILCCILYSGLLWLLEAENFQLAGIDVNHAISASIVIFVATGLVLSRLRREFDERLDAMQESFLFAEAARKRAEEADNAKSQFLANMSHELRTPLNATIGYSEAMLGGMAGDFTDQQKKLLGHIQFNSRRLLALINDVLDLSKVESGSLEVYLAPMSPRKLIEQTVGSLESLAHGKGINLDIQFADTVPEVVLSDSKKLEQILVNLTSNAIKFTSEGGVTVNVYADPSASKWGFSVADTGIGMPADAMHYIFEPFRQIDNSSTRVHKGTGLGLSISKKLVEHLDGTITVESEEGKGTIFTVTLPKASIPTADDAEEKQEEAEIALASG